MNRKSILLPFMAFAMLCMSFSFTSCDKESRAELIGSLIGDAIEYLCTDSTNYLAGAWVCSVEGGGTDTIYFMTDGTWRERTKTTDMNCVESGTYIYYKSEKNLLRNADKLFNYTTGQYLDYTNQYIDRVSKFKLSIAQIDQLTLTSFDLSTGELTDEAITYTKVK